jgi:hypothetical protein
MQHYFILLPLIILSYFLMFREKIWNGPHQTRIRSDKLKRAEARAAKGNSRPVTVRGSDDEGTGSEDNDVSEEEEENEDEDESNLDQVAPDEGSHMDVVIEAPFDEENFISLQGACEGQCEDTLATLKGLREQFDDSVLLDYNLATLFDAFRGKLDARFYMCEDNPLIMHLNVRSQFSTVSCSSTTIIYYIPVCTFHYYYYAYSILTV